MTEAWERWKLRQRPGRVRILVYPSGMYDLISPKSIVKTLDDRKEHDEQGHDQPDRRPQP